MPSCNRLRPPLGAAAGEALAVAELLVAQEHQRMPTIEITDWLAAVGAADTDDPVLHPREPIPARLSFSTA